MVLDTVIQRSELYSFKDALHWAADGSLAINTTSHLTILNPKYNKNESVKFSNDLFEINKIDIEKTFPSNKFFLSEVEDERTSTLHSAVDTAVVKLGWSPLIDQSCILTLLTNHHSLLLFRNNELWKDVTTTKTFSNQAELDQHMVHSFDWLRLGEDLYLLTGLASGHIRYFKLTSDDLVEETIIKVSDTPIVRIKVFGKSIIAVSSANEIYHILKDQALNKIIPEQRFLIYDFWLDDSVLYHSQSNKIIKTHLHSSKSQELVTKLYESSTIIPVSGDSFLVITDSQSIKISIPSFQIEIDDIVEPVLTKKLNKWNSKYNDFNTKNFKLKKFGYDLNFDGKVLAIIYEIVNVDGFRYQIASENLFKIAYIPVSNNFEYAKGSSMAIYQEYKITGQLNFNTETQDDINTDSRSSTDVPFDGYLATHLLKDPQLLKYSIQNLITRDQNDLIRKRYAELVLKYIKDENLDINNEIDLFVLNSLKLITNEPDISELGVLEFKAAGFSEFFDFSDNGDLSVVRSTQNHVWPRCSLTLLPIMSPFVKIDPVTETRILDIERDELNDYGVLTKSILSLNKISIYSGTHLKTK